ncbi:MAG: PD40 domain-containing protein [Bacteroidia bacterium]|nr:PD40 domain-containing protein [Bacteroidia bacterium]
MALEYGENAAVCQGLGQAEKALHNYRQALQWFQRAATHSGDTATLIPVMREAADLQKRCGNFMQAHQFLDSLRNMDQGHQEYWLQMKNDFAKAEMLIKDSADFELWPEPGDVNSAYSDFAPAALGDSLLFYSSLRYMQATPGGQAATSRVAVVNTSASLHPKSVVLPSSVNQASFNNANASVSPDGKIMVFSRCLYDEDGKLKCALYESVFSKGQWQEAVKLSEEINPSGYSSTQPNISTNKSEGYLLIFSSNKKGGMGGMDLWMSKRTAAHKYEKPQNLGKSINTESDEWSPFYDVETDSLYFATEKAEGPGGLDLFIVSLTNREGHLPRCLPPPFNSPYNDLYYTRSYGEKHQIFLVSNRPPATSLNGSACCYDIFRMNHKAQDLDTGIVAVLDTVLHSPNPEEEFSALPLEKKLESIRMDFPIRLYFDNDYPDPRSRASKTKTQYEQLASQYILRERNYLDQQANDSLKNLISLFFRDSVNGNFLKLEKFSEKLLTCLESGNYRLRITIRGSASPLAESDYNVILSKRRIHSLENYWLTHQGGLLKEAMEGRKLEIVFIPAGETGAKSGISDDLKDQAKSIYSLEAALERRIEVTDITLLP